MITHATHDTHVVEKISLGFWLYIMSDCIMFATLFVVYAVIHNNSFGGTTISQIVSLPFVLLETIVLLASSFTYGLASIAVQAKKITATVVALISAWILGALFVALELYEFNHLIHDGINWTSSAAFSIFFTLVGAHALHVSIGLLWMGAVITYIVSRGVQTHTAHKVLALGLFWHFLDIIWILLFTVVYLFNAI
jgi:cytochrome o ubiquinol oxidase subunit 3